MNINLMDPGLANVAGHHFDADLKIARTLAEDGHRVRIYAHATASEHVLRAFRSHGEIQPLFRSSVYVDPRQVDPIAGEAIVYLRHSEALAQDLRSTAPADVWLWPTLFAAQLHACAGLSGDTLVAGCVQMDASSEERPNGAMWWRHALIEAKRAGMRLRIGGMEPDHRYEYLPLTADGEFHSFPNFYEGKPSGAPKTSLRTVGFFGHQRGEKGDSMIPALVAKLVAKGCQVILQDSAERFRPQDRASITTLGFVDNLAEEIARCDLVVLPYSPERYRRRGSGILLDALASGVPAVAPFDTIPGRWLERTGAGTQFVRATTPDILAAIDEAERRFPAIAAAAARTSASWRRRFGVKRFVEAMLG